MPLPNPRPAIGSPRKAALSPLFLGLLALLVMLASAHAMPGPARGGLLLRGKAGAPPAETLKDTPNHRVVRSAPSPDDPAARTMDQDARRAQSAVVRVLNPIDNSNNLVLPGISL